MAVRKIGRWQVSEAPTRVQSKTVPFWIDQRSLEIAKEIEDVFAMGHEGGAVQRRAAIQVLVLDAMMMARGEARGDR